MGGHLAKLLHGIPHVVTSHSLEPQRPWKAEQLGGGYRVSSWAEQTAYEAADAVIAVSHGSKRDVMASYPALDEAKVHVVHNGIDTDFYRPDPATDVLERLGVDPDRPSVVFVGRITRQKGVPHLLRAALQFDESAQLVLLAGAADTPELAAETDAAIEQLQSTRDGVFIVSEMLPRDEVRQVLTHGTVFVCPSVYEPLGIVNLEAMACETAVVASDVGGIPEVVDDGTTGLLVHYDAVRADRRSRPTSQRRSTGCSPTGAHPGRWARRAACARCPSSAGTPPPARRWRSTSRCSDAPIDPPDLATRKARVRPGRPTTLGRRMSTTDRLPELPKAYSPADTEAAITAAWNASDVFHADPVDAGHPTYSIVIPPPNVTAALHLGHALNNTLQDVLIRYHRMRGDETLWMPGTDHAGIATQTVVEKRLLADGIKRLEMGREAFVATTQEWKDEYEQVIIDQLVAMGASCDFERTRFTMDEMCATAVRHAFFVLFGDGLIYRGKRLVNWDPATRTALSDDEVENEDVDGHMWYLQYPLADGIRPRHRRHDATRRRCSATPPSPSTRRPTRRRARRQDGRCSRSSTARSRSSPTTTS